MAIIKGKDKCRLTVWEKTEGKTTCPGFAKLSEACLWEKRKETFH